MSQRLGWYLFTDPAFERTYEDLKQRGFQVNVIARDSFEETVASGLFEIERSMRTFLGTPFDTARDRLTKDILVTTDVPITEKGEMPSPMKDEYVFTFNWLREGLAKKNRTLPIFTIIESEKTILREAIRQRNMILRERQKALNRNRGRYIR